MTFHANPKCFPPRPRLRVLSRISGLANLDDEMVTPEEKVKAVNLYGGEGSDLASRKANWAKCFPDADFIDFLPSFQETEEDPARLVEEEKASELSRSGAFVGGIIDEAMKTVVQSS